MTAMAARFLAVAVAAVLAAGGLAAAPTGAGAWTSTADAKVTEVCRFGPFSPSATTPGAFSAVFAVRATNVGGTVSDGTLNAGINHPVQIRQKRDLVPVTPGPMEPGQTVRFKWKDGLLFPGVQMTMIAAFASQTNPSEDWVNNMTFADPWAVPAC